MKPKNKILVLDVMRNVQHMVEFIHGCLVSMTEHNLVGFCSGTMKF